MSRHPARHRPPARHRTRKGPATRRGAALVCLATGALLVGGVQSAGTGTPHRAMTASAAPAADHAREALLAPGDTAARGSAAAQRSTARSAAPAALPQRVLADTARSAARVGDALRVSDRSLAAGTDAAAAGSEQVARVAEAQQVHPPILVGTRTSSYGWRWGRMHHGMDIAAGHGTPLYAVGQGTVTTAGYNSGLGNHVKITLEDGTVLVYGHLSTVAVGEDDVVAGGTVLGEVGSTGRSTGAHLHLEVRIDDESIDPGPWLDERFPDGW